MALIVTPWSGTFMCICSVGLVIIPCVSAVCIWYFHFITYLHCTCVWMCGSSLNLVSLNESLCVCLASVLPPTLVWLLLGVQWTLKEESKQNVNGGFHFHRMLTEEKRNKGALISLCWCVASCMENILLKLFRLESQEQKQMNAKFLIHATFSFYLCGNKWEKSLSTGFACVGVKGTL